MEKERVRLIPSLEACLDILFDVMQEDALDNEKKMLKEIRERLGWMVINRRKLESKKRKRNPGSQKTKQAKLVISDLPMDVIE